MNEFLQKNIILLAFLAFPLLTWGQAVELHTFQNTAVTYEFISAPNSPYVANSNPPDHGSVQIETNESTPSSYDYIFTYTPDDGFVGEDNFRIGRWEYVPFIHFSSIEVTVHVAPALIQAHHDYAATHSGETVVVDVLANDISSNGVKLLQAVPAINHGQASFDATTGLITFTPDEDYVGLAHFNYNLCNGAGDCHEGTVSISVMPNQLPNGAETIEVFTKKEQSQFILVPEDYTLSQMPAKGVFDGAADVPTYTPNIGELGADEIRFTNGTHELIFAITILDLRSNVFAMDDRVFTTTNSVVDITPFDNDASTGSATSGCTSFSNPSNGTITRTGGLFTYTPDVDFVGVDQFTYTSHSNACQGAIETATVTVFVSNFEPAQTTFEMATPKSTPIIIGYNVPTATFDFEITDQGTLGEAIFLPGAVDTEINGVQIQGDNLLIYIPNEGVNTGVDQLEVTYCLADPASGDCMVSKQVKIWMTILDVGAGDTPVCVGDCVWAGDTNADGVVNMNDLLPIGLNMGKIGNERSDASSPYWYGQYAEDWGSLLSAASDVNIKHIDADGDSMVTAEDTTAIRNFYGRVHNMLPSLMPYAPYEFVIEGPLFVEPGDLVEFKIKLGTANQPAEDVYGFVFPFEYNADAVDEESIRVQWQDDNFMAYDSPVLSMEHNDYTGKFEAGYTRTSALVASGYGTLGALGIVIDDLEGFRADQDEYILTIGGGEGSAMNSRGEMMAVPVRPIEVRVRLNNDTAEDSALAAHQLKVWPNPTSALLSVHLNGQQEFQQLTLRTLTGKVVRQMNGLNTNDITLNIESLAAGMYVLSVANEKGVINTKVEVIK